MTVHIYACVVCGQELRPETPGVLTQVVGWTEPRSAGGANHIIMREKTGRYAHKGCAAEPTADQPGLF